MAIKALQGLTYGVTFHLKADSDNIDFQDCFNDVKDSNMFISYNISYANSIYFQGLHVSSSRNGDDDVSLLKVLDGVTTFVVLVVVKHFDSIVFIINKDFAVVSNENLLFVAVFT